MGIKASGLLDHLPVAALTLDDEGLVRESNAHLCAALGMSPSSLHGLPIARLLTRAAAVLWQSRIWPCLRDTGHVQDQAIQLQHAQGWRIDALFSAERTRRRNGLGVVQCVFMGLNSHDQLEAMLLRAKRAADEAPGLLFQLRRPSPHAAPAFVYVTEAARALFGLAPRQVLDDAQALWLRVHPEDRAVLMAGLEASAQALKPWRAEFRRLVQDQGTTGDEAVARPAPDLPAGTGDPVPTAWTEVQAAPSRELDGALVWSGYIADISERKALEASVREKALAEYASQAKSDFLARMSHELRTPLNGILGFAQLLRMQSPGNLRDDQFDKLGFIETAGHNLLNLINEVLEISRIEAGHMHVDLADVDLDEVVQNSVRLAEPVAAQRGVKLVCTGLRGLRAQADPQRLGQILLNLLSNAVKYGPAGGQVTVQVRAMDNGDARGARGPQGQQEVAISVKDQGPGLTPVQQAQLFQPFNRLGAERGEVEGTGLGLVITRGLAELMGGRLQVCSVPGQGASFTVCLKLAGTQAEAGSERGGAVPDRQDAAEPDPAVAVQPDLARQRLMYVEDNPANALLMRSLFERSRDFELEVVESGEKAMARLRGSGPWPVGFLLDMQLPDTDGISLMRSLKSLPGWHDQPVIAVSANAMPEGIDRAREAGFTDYWTKPLDVGHVQRVLRRLLGPSAPH